MCVYIYNKDIYEARCFWCDWSSQETLQPGFLSTKGTTEISLIILIPSGKLTVCYWKYPIRTGIYPLNMVIIYSYVSLPKGKPICLDPFMGSTLFSENGPQFQQILGHVYPSTTFNSRSILDINLRYPYRSKGWGGTSPHKSRPQNFLPKKVGLDP
jgi:hypothetical protein